jgi:hypothetical protein
MLSKKHYEAIAKIIRNCYADIIIASDADVAMQEYISKKLADYFGQDNPKFDRDKFMYACMRG